MWFLIIFLEFLRYELFEIVDLNLGEFILIYENDTRKVCLCFSCIIEVEFIYLLVIFCFFEELMVVFFRVSISFFCKKLWKIF